jgi:hypothetical protein
MKASPMSMVGFPLLLIPLAIYNIIAFLMPGVSFADPLVRLKLVSGAEWPITLSDVMLALGILLLLHEVIKGARPGGKYLTDHLLSLIVFGASAAEFVMWPKFGTSTYFLLVLLAMVDFFSGVVLRTQRGARPKAAARSAAPREVATAPDPVPAEPQAEQHVEPAAPPPADPEPARVMPSAASVAESVLMDHPEPKVAQPAVAESEPAPAPASDASEEPKPVIAPPPETSPPASEPAPASATENEPSPQIPSPELQPGSDAPASPERPRH